MRILCIVCLFFIFSCSENNSNEAVNKGFLSFRLDIDDEITVTSRADNPSIDDYSVAILNSDGSTYVKWARYADVPHSMTLDIGEFTLKASYGDMDSEGFDLTPGYGASQSFAIAAGATTEIEITCRMAQTLVHIDYTEAFKKYFPGRTITLKSTNGGYVLYDATETRPAYLKPGDIAAALTLTKQDGSVEALSKTLIANAQAGSQYNITFDLAAGGAAIQVTFDNSLDLQPLLIDIRDNEMRTLPPFFTATGFNHNQPVSVLEGDTYQGSLMAMLTAQGGIASCTLKTESTTLKAAGFPENLDLCTTNATTVNLMKEQGLAFYGLQGTVDKMAVVDFGKLTESLMIDGVNTKHTFTLTATDIYGRQSEPLTLQINNLPFSMTLDTPDAQPLGNESVNLTVTLPEKADASHIQVWENKNGIYQSVTSNLIAQTGNQYTFSAPLSVGLDAQKVKMTYNKMSSNEVSVLPDLENIPFALSCTEANSWARHALLDISAEKAIQRTAALKNMSHVYAKAADGNWTEVAFSLTADNQIKIIGLTDNVDYEVRGTCAKTLGNPLYSSSATFHTESATQIPNSGFETWEKTWLRKKTIIFASGEDIYIYTPYTATDSNPWWETLDAYTTQHPESESYASWYYVSYPGTVPTPSDHDATDYWLSKTASAHSGSSAAEISTVGWGANNWSAISKNTEKVTPGRLFIGKLKSYSATDFSIDYGRLFSSRPTKMAFYYRFVPFNSESAQAYIVIKDAAGQEIGRGTVNISTGTDTWKKQEVTINYTVDHQKAASMYIEFISSTATEPKTNTYEKGKALNNGYGQSRHIGNVLSVDDVELIYE